MTNEVALELSQLLVDGVVKIREAFWTSAVVLRTQVDFSSTLLLRGMSAADGYCRDGESHLRL